MEDYSYDSFGHRLGLTDTRYTNGQPETEQRYSYGYDVQGSVSLLLNEAGGARAAYGYTPYGKPDADLTKGDTDQTNPFNSYRYSAKRFDSGSGSVDMGARRFGPKPARFLLRDFYHRALADQRLSLDPLTQNRYGPAGGNPISFVEVDGHDPHDEQWQQEFTQAHGRKPE